MRSLSTATTMKQLTVGAACLLAICLQLWIAQAQSSTGKASDDHLSASLNLYFDCILQACWSPLRTRMLHWVLLDGSAVEGLVYCCHGSSTNRY